MYDCRTNMTAERGDTLVNKEIRCTAPGRFRQYQSRICGRTGTLSKITQKMVGRTPPGGFTPQPMHLCDKHWQDYPEVSGLSGAELRPQRRWPG